MNRQVKTLAGLTVVLLGLGGIATWDEWKTKQDEKDKETKGVILPIKPDQVHGIHLVSRADADTGEKSSTANTSPSVITDVTLKREDGIWMIKSPVATKADQQVITDLLKSITEYKSESEVGNDKAKWPTFGLESPRRRVDLELADGKSESLLIGINAPVGFSAYSATAKSPTIFSGSQYIATSLGKTLFDLRDKKFVEIAAGNIKNFQVTYPKLKLALHRDAKGWTIDSPSSAQADAVMVNNLLDDLTGLQALEFVDQPDAKFLTDIKRSQVHSTWDLSFGEGKSASIKIFEVKEALYAQSSGSATYFKIGADNKSKLLRTFDQIRDKRIFNFESATVTAIKVDGESFKKKGTDWVVASDEAKPAQHIRGLLVDLEYAKAEAVLNEGNVLKKLPKSPMHSIFITSGNEELNISTWDSLENKEMAYLKSSKSPDIYQIKKSLLANIAPQTLKPVGDELMPTSKD